MSLDRQIIYSAVSKSVSAAMIYWSLKLAFQQKILFSIPTCLPSLPESMSTTATVSTLSRPAAGSSGICRMPWSPVVSQTYLFHFGVTIRFARRFTRYFYTMQFVRASAWVLSTRGNWRCTTIYQPNCAMWSRTSFFIETSMRPRNW